MSQITYRVATPEDKSLIAAQYPETFGKHEPLHEILGHMDHAPFFPLYLDFILAQGVSHVAIDNDSQELAGFSLNEIIGPGDEDQLELALKQSRPLCNPQTIKSTDIICSYLGELHSKFNELYSDKKVFHITIGSVLKKYQKRGIHYQFVKLREERAMKTGCELIVVEATSSFSQRNYEKLGYQCINYIPYETFQYNGEYVLAGRNITIHPGGKSMFKSLV